MLTAKGTKTSEGKGANNVDRKTNGYKVIINKLSDQNWIPSLQRHDVPFGRRSRRRDVAVYKMLFYQIIWCRIQGAETELSHPIPTSLLCLAGGFWSLSKSSSPGEAPDLLSAQGNKRVGSQGLCGIAPRWLSQGDWRQDCPENIGVETRLAIAGCHREYTPSSLHPQCTKMLPD